ncbi:MAG: GTPase Era [Bacilli bacterium]|nr:GTPase Era [Bacilli bacterium]
MFKSGFVSIIGRPNVGKSTFLNYCLGQKVSIISPKPQTTRNVIQGIYTTDDAQIIFIDTPGIHKPKHELGEYMNKQAFRSIKDVDLVLLLFDGATDFGTGDEFVLRMLKKINASVILVINKIDLVKDKNRLLENVAKLHENYEFIDTFYISALNGDNVEELLKEIINNLEEGPMYYPKDQVSDHPEKFVISEIIREKILLKTSEEVPHSVAVVTEDVKHVDGLLNVRANIIVERASQKKIIIGAGGKMIKEIGTLARQDIEKVVGEKLFLDLWVKVIPDLRDREAEIKRLGYTLDN